MLPRRRPECQCPVDIDKVSFESFGRKSPLPHLIQRIFQRKLEALRFIRFYRSSDAAHRAQGRTISPTLRARRRIGDGTPLRPPRLYSSRSRGKPRPATWTDKPHVAALAPEGLGVATAHRPDATRSTLILRIPTRRKKTTALISLFAQRSAGLHGRGYAPRPIAKVYEGCASQRRTAR